MHSVVHSKTYQSDHNHDVGEIIVIVSFVGINHRKLQGLIDFVNYFIFM
jgi:hypothetical protein